MRALSEQKDVSNEPPTPLGSFETSSTSYRRKAGPAVGAAGSMTDCRSTGVLPAKPLSEDLGDFKAVSKSPKPQEGGSPSIAGGRLSVREVNGKVLGAALQLAIRDLERLRRTNTISSVLRSKLGRCLYELHDARRCFSAHLEGSI